MNAPVGPLTFRSKQRSATDVGFFIVVFLPAYTTRFYVCMFDTNVLFRYAHN